MESMNNNDRLGQTLQDGKLYRQLYSLIVAHLRGSNLNQAASAVALATINPLNVESPPNKLLELVAKGLVVDKDEMLSGVPSAALFDSSVHAGYGSIPPPRAAAVDSVPCLIPKNPQRALQSMRHDMYQTSRMKQDMQDLVPMEGFLQLEVLTHLLNSLRYQKLSK